MVFCYSQGTTTEFDQFMHILQVYDVVGLTKDEELCNVNALIKAALGGAAKQHQLSVTELAGM